MGAILLLFHTVGLHNEKDVCTCRTHVLLIHAHILRQRFTDEDEGDLPHGISTEPCFLSDCDSQLCGETEIENNHMRVMKRITAAAWHRRSEVTDLP